MYSSNKLENIIEQGVKDAGFCFVGLEIVPQRNGQIFRVYAELEEGYINIDQLQQASRQVDALLTVELPDLEKYTLELSSPGIERPLFKLEDYDRFKGEEVKIKLKQAINGSKKYRGRVVAVESEEIELELEDGLRQKIQFSSIAKAKLLPQLSF